MLCEEEYVLCLVVIMLSFVLCLEYVGTEMTFDRMCQKRKHRPPSLYFGSIRVIKSL